MRLGKHGQGTNNDELTKFGKPYKAQTLTPVNSETFIPIYLHHLLASSQAEAAAAAEGGLSEELGEREGSVGI